MFVLRKAPDMFTISFCFCLFEAKPTLPTNFEEDTWAKLKSAISAIFLKQPDPCDLEKLYQVHSTIYIYVLLFFLFLKYL